MVETVNTLAKISPVVNIKLGKRIKAILNHLDVVYIRHENCPYCGNKVEVVMREYLGNEGQFQRGVHIRKPISKEDNELKKRQRIIELYPQ